jgi:hypothetical protein
MTAAGWWFAALLVFSSPCAAQAAPNIPSSELPGRERERFTPSPVERFMQAPAGAARPVIRHCGDRKVQREGKPRSKGRKGC